jgi:hypothetical protein
MTLLPPLPSGEIKTDELLEKENIMKLFIAIPLSICLAITSCHAAPKVLLAQNANASKIAQVKAGTLKTANANWWGFNKEDATQCLQDAINSGVPKLIVDNTGSDWVISKPINLVSNQEITFADGVVIQAQKGCFKGTKDALFNGNAISNFALIGQGNVVFRMHRDDYANPALYEKAEWRHGINLRDCSNAIFRNITVTETGGDGLYLGATANGANKNVLVENMNFDANYRQGISVISADGLTVRNCKLNNTFGTNPQAGIDFEPNAKGQSLANCLLENCEIIGNHGGGIDISPTNLDGTSKPMSITFKNCTVGGNSGGVATNPSHPDTTNPVKGIVTFSNCTFDHAQIRLRDPVIGSISYLFQNTTLDFSIIKDAKTASWRNSPFVISTKNPPAGRPLGDITFDHVTVINDGSAPISLNYQNKATIADSIAGDIYLKQGDQINKYDLAGFIKNKQDEFRKINSMVPATIDLNELHAPASGAPRKGNNTFYLRNKFTFLQYANKGESITINVTVKKIYPKETQVELLDPSGKKIQTYTIPLDNKPFPITFTAAETGVYRVVRTQDFSQYIDITSANPGNGLLADGPIEFLPHGGKLYFQVPAGVKEFTIGVATDSTADVVLLNPAGQEVDRQNGLNSMHLFSATRSDASKSEIWSIDVSQAVWAVMVNMYTPLTPVVSTNPDTLLLK